jgi:hypothetical protein
LDDGFQYPLNLENKLRLHNIFPLWQTTLAEDSEALAAAADNTIRLAQRQKAQANIKRTQDKLTTQQRRLTDISKPPQPPEG